MLSVNLFDVVEHDIEIHHLIGTVTQAASEPTRSLSVCPSVWLLSLI